MKNQIQNNIRMQRKRLHLFTKTFQLVLCTFLLWSLALLNLQAQSCATPAATRTINLSAGEPLTWSSTAIETIYLTGSGTYTSGMSVTNPNGTVVLTAGSHLSIASLAVDAGSILIVQEGATITVRGVNRPTPQNPISSIDFNVGGGGRLNMCQNSAIEVCGYAQLFTNGQINYIGTASGKAVIKGQRNGTGAFTFGAGTTNSPNLVIVTEENDPVNFIYSTTNTANGGYATKCVIGGACTSLPFTVTGTCGEFATQTPVTCLAGNTAPSVSPTTISNTCPATTVNLNSIVASNQPANTILTWHTGTPATTANKVATPTAVSTSGTYYAAFFDPANSCYSGTAGAATTAVTVTVNACPAPGAGTIDCSKTSITTAPVAGQKTLTVTINVTTAGCFSPLTVSGSGMTIANQVNQVCTTTTGVQTFSIPVKYDGSALGTMNFTIGQAGSCTADLTKVPKKAITDVWTLDCVPTVGPSLK